GGRRATRPRPRSHLHAHERTAEAGGLRAMNAILRGIGVALIACGCVFAADVVAVFNNTTYDAGSQVNVRLVPAAEGIASIRYAGEEKPLLSDIALHGAEYQPLWNVPWDARTGRYQIDLAIGGRVIRDAGSFAVH